MKYLAIFIIMLCALDCAGKLIQFDQYSVAMNLKVEPDSSILIGSDEKFTGVLFLASILKEEKVKTGQVKLIKNYGKYFLCAENFKNVWMIEPQEDGSTAYYKAIDVTPKDKEDNYKDISFSRYGERDNVLIKFKYNKKEVFIDRKGKINEKNN